MKTMLFSLIFSCSFALAMDDNDLNAKNAELDILSTITSIKKIEEGNTRAYVARWKNGNIDYAQYYPSSGRCHCSRTLFCHNSSLNTIRLLPSHYDFLERLYESHKSENTHS